MNINFKGGDFNLNFLTKSDGTLSSESMDNAQSVHGLSGHCPVCLDSLDKSRVSMDNVQTVH